MPSDLTARSGPRRLGKKAVPFDFGVNAKTKRRFFDFGFLGPLVSAVSALGVGAFQPNGRFRGQGSVEYLFVVVFLVGFIVAVLVPSLQTAEVSYALAGARSAAVGFEAHHPDVRLMVLNYSVSGAYVWMDATVYNRSSDARIATPQGLKDAMLSGIHALAPASGVDGACANTSNYAYCFVS